MPKKASPAIPKLTLADSSTPRPTVARPRPISSEMSKSTANRQLDRRREKVEVPPCSSSLREAIARLMRHHNLNVTYHYLQSSTEDKTAVKKLRFQMNKVRRINQPLQLNSLRAAMVTAGFQANLQRSTSEKAHSKPDDDAPGGSSAGENESDTG